MNLARLIVCLGLLAASAAQAITPDGCIRVVGFEPGSATLQPRAREQLAVNFEAGGWYEKNYKEITIYGNAGKSESADPVALAAQRAEAVWNYLVSLGFPGERLRLVNNGASISLGRWFAPSQSAPPNDLTQYVMVYPGPPLYPTPRN